MKNSSGIFLLILVFSLLQPEVYSLGNEVVLKPNYTSINLDVSYRTAKNLQETYNWFVEGYYRFVDAIIDLILPDALPEEIFKIGLDGTIFINIGKILWAYRRLLIFVIILLIQIVFLICSNIKIFCSCIFFCTKYCNRKVRKSNGKFRKWLWLVWVYASVVFLLLMLLLAHQSNQNMDEGIDTVILTLDDTIFDIETFIDTTVKQLEILLLNNLQDYLTFFLDTGEKTTMDILTDLEGILTAIDFSKIFEDIEDNFNFVKPIFDEIETLVGDVEGLGKSINEDITGLKNMVENVICKNAECEQLKKLIPSLDSIYDGGASVVNGTYAELGNIAGLGEKGLENLGNLTYVIGGKAIEEGKALENLTANIAGNVGGGLANLTSAIGGEAIDEGKALENLTANIAGNVIKDLEITGGGLANLTSGIGGEAIEEGKAIENLTANIAGNVIKDLEITGAGLANLTSDIGGEAIEEGKALKNLTANIAGNVVKDLEIYGGGLANLTSSIGGEAIEEGKALKNLTANIAGDVIKDLEITGGGLANLTSDIGGEAIEEGKAIENLTANIAGDVIKDLEITGGGLANLTTSIGGEAIEEGKALENLTANIAGDVITDLEITGGGLANFTSSIGGEAIEEGKALENLTANIAGDVIKDLEITGGGLANLTSSIGVEAIDEGKALENLTANIAGDVVKDLEITGGSLANLTSSIGGEAIEEGKALENLTANIAGDVIKDLEITGGGLDNLTSAIGGEAIEEGKALENLTANIAGNVIKDLEITGGGLANLTSSIGGDVIEEGKALENLTANLAGNVVKDLEITGGDLANLTSSIGGEAIEEGKALENLTTNIAGDVIKDLEITGGGLANLTSSIGGEAIKKGKALENLTANIAGNVIKDLEITEGGLTNLTSDIGGEAIKEGKALENLTANIAGNVFKDFEITGGDLANLTSAIGGGAIEEGKALENLTEKLVSGLGDVAGGIQNEIKNEEKAVKDLTENVAGGVVSGIGNVAGGLEDEVEDVFGGLDSWTFGSGGKKEKSKDNKHNKDFTSSSRTEKNERADIGVKLIKKEKNLGNLSSNVVGSVLNGSTNFTIVGGLENVAGSVGNEIIDEEKALKNFTKNVAGGVVSSIDNVAGGLENEVGGLFEGIGGWTFGSPDKKGKSKDSEPNKSGSAVPQNRIHDASDIPNVPISHGGTNNEGGKNEITKDSGLAQKDISIDDSTMDLTLSLKNDKTDIAIDSICGQTNDFNSLLAGLGDLEKGIEKSGNVISGGIGDSTSGVENEAMGIFGGLGGWSSSGTKNTKHKEESIVTSTTVRIAPVQKNVEKKSEGDSGGFFGGFENLASGISDGIMKTENKLGSLTSKVVGGVGNTAGNVENQFGGLFGDWSSSGSSRDQNEADNTKAKVSESKKEETVTPKNINNGYGTWFGGYSMNKEAKTSGKIAPKVPGGKEKASRVFDASKKLHNIAGSFGFRKRRGIDLGFNDMKNDFNMIFNTIDRIENYVLNDLKHLNNVSVILSPILEEIGSIVKDVLAGVENELKEATKPLESLFATTIDNVISIENSILNSTQSIIRGTQDIINWFEVYRYHVSNFIAAALLISFTLLTFGISVRMTYSNVITKCTYMGGFTLLHFTALLMAITSLVYIIVGLTSQKVLCETFDLSYKEVHIMRILSRINPAKYGLIVDTNLHKIILRCHQDKSIYDVMALKSVTNIEKMALEFFDFDSIEKEFEPLLNLNPNFSKYLPLDAIHTIEEDLNFEAFEKMVDLPIFTQIEKLEKEFAHIPMIGPVINTIAGKIDIFKDKIASIKSPAQSAKVGFPNFLSNMKNLLVGVENELLEIERKSVKSLQDVVLDFKNLLLTSLKDYVYNRLIYSIEHDIGRCQPISAAINATLNSVCRRITTPANGQWFSWFIGIFLSIILIVLAREVDGKIKGFKKEKEGDPSTESSKNVDEIDMKSFNDKKVEIDGEKEAIQSEDAL